MKFKTLSSAALVAAIALGALSPVGAFAAPGPTELDSTGKVIVGDGEAGGGGTVTIDPEDPTTTLPDPDEPGTEVTNPDKGSLVIEKTTNLDFGSIGNSTTAITKPALPMKFAGGTKTRGAYVQWADVRSSDSYGYKVTAELAQQFTGALSNANKLSNASIIFSNGLLTKPTTNTNDKPVAQTGFELKEGAGGTAGAAVEVVTADKTLKQGKGQFIIEFGQSNDYTGTEGTKGTDDKSVNLFVPKDTASNLVKDTYTAKITWKIVAAL